MRSVQAGGVEAFVYAPEEPSGLIVYTFSDAVQAAALFSRAADTGITLCALSGTDWERSLSPWKAPRAFKGAADFGGGADDLLRTLTASVLPAVEAASDVPVRCRALAGYSLAGLFSLYALYRTDVFRRAASVSGSLWYDGFLDFMRENAMPGRPERVYLSLGDRESAVRDPRLARVNDCTNEAAALLAARGIRTENERNPGGHFRDVDARMEKAIRFLAQEENT